MEKAWEGVKGLAESQWEVGKELIGWAHSKHIGGRRLNCMVASSSVGPWTLRTSLEYLSNCSIIIANDPSEFMYRQILEGIRMTNKSCQERSIRAHQEPNNTPTQSSTFLHSNGCQEANREDREGLLCSMHGSRAGEPAHLPVNEEDWKPQNQWEQF